MPLAISPSNAGVWITFNIELSVLKLPFSNQSESSTRFVIWCQERSGSSHLGMLLCSHPAVTCLLEVFDAIPLGESITSNQIDFPVYKSGNWHYRRCLHVADETIMDPDEKQVKDRLREIFRLPYQACGFKFKAPTQFDAYPELMDELLQDRESLHVICLTRRNVLKQAISRQNMQRLVQLAESEEFDIANCNLTSEANLPPFELDIAQALKYAREINTYQSEFIRPLDAFSHVKVLDYEDVLRTPQETYASLLEFLNVPDSGSPESYFCKSTPDDLRLAITNYDELALAVADSEFESMLV